MILNVWYLFHYLDHFRDAIVINIVSFFTSLYAGFAVFSVIGYMANEYGIKVEEVIDSGKLLSLSISISLSLYLSMLGLTLAFSSRSRFGSYNLKFRIK